MEDQSICVFARERAAPPLRLLRDALLAAGYPASMGVSIAGEATDAELDATDWEAALVRWNEPEMHEVLWIERDVRSEDEEAEAAIAHGLRQVANSPDLAGQMIVTDHLRRTECVYEVQILPALHADQDHPAWGVLDVALRCLAAHTNGMIYLEAEGFCDADGELLLDEADDEESPGSAESETS